MSLVQGLVRRVGGYVDLETQQGAAHAVMMKCRYSDKSLVSMVQSMVQSSAGCVKYEMPAGGLAAPDANGMQKYSAGGAG